MRHVHAFFVAFHPELLFFFLYPLPWYSVSYPCPPPDYRSGGECS